MADANDDAALLRAYKQAHPGASLLQPDDLLPNAHGIYEAALKNLGIATMPIILDITKQNFDQAVRIERSDLLPQMVENHGHYLSISEYSHRWTANQRIGQAFTDTRLDDMDRVSDERVLQALATMAEKRGIHPLPQLRYQDPPYTNSTSITQGGRVYILLNPKQEISMQIGTMAHELGHVEHGDYILTKVAALHNSQDFVAYRAREWAADETAAKLCQGRAFADSLASIDAQWREMFAAIKIPYNDTSELRSGPSHPPLHARIERLRSQAALAELAGSCPVADAPSTPVEGATQVDRQALPHNSIPKAAHPKGR